MMEPKINDYSSEERFLYLLLFAPGSTNEFNERIIGNTWLQKQMYLLKKIIPGISISFDECQFGAFSSELVALQNRNIVEKIIVQKNKVGSMHLSETGLEIGQQLWNAASESEMEDISNVKKFMNDMTREELIAYSYSTFPNTAVNSDILDYFEETRVDAACSLFSKDKVSLKKASSVAGMSVDDFVLELGRQNIPIFTVSESAFKKSMDCLERIR